MSMASDVRCTALYFCIENDIPQDKAIALLNELVEDMDGDPDNYNFGEWVASEYARLQKSRPTQRALDLPCTCPKFENGSKVFPMRECDGCRKSASQ